MSSKKHTWKTRVIAFMIAGIMVACSMIIPHAVNREQAHADGQTREVSTWSELKSAIAAAGNGDTIAITKDVVATEALTVKGKSLKIQGSGSGVTVYRDKNNADFTVFTVDNGGSLELGDKLTLTGRTGTYVDDPSGNYFEILLHNGGSGSAARTVGPQRIAPGTVNPKYSAPAPPEAGLIFKGWKAKDPDGAPVSSVGKADPTVLPYTIPDNKYGRMTLVAQWERPAVGKFRVKWTSGTSSELTETYDAGTVLSYTPPSNWKPNDDYEFAGWKWIAPDGTRGSSNGANTGFIAPAGKYGLMTIVARWKEKATSVSPLMSWDAVQAAINSDGYVLLGEVDKQTGKPKSFFGIDPTNDYQGKGFWSGYANGTVGWGSLGSNMWSWTIQDKGDGNYASGEPIRRIKANGWKFSFQRKTKLPWLGYKGENYWGDEQGDSWNGGMYQLALENGTGYLLASSNSGANVKNYVKRDGNTLTWEESIRAGHASAPVAFYKGSDVKNSNGGGTPTYYNNDASVTAFAEEDLSGQSGEIYPGIGLIDFVPQTVPQRVDSSDNEAKYTSGTAKPADKIYRFSGGTADSPRGFFVQIKKGGQLNINGAVLRSFITDATVQHTAPVVADGGTLNIKGSSEITQNSVGYGPQDNAKAGHQAMGGAEPIKPTQLNQYPRTCSAGAAIYTNGAGGKITGGNIHGNRGDAGALIIEGSGGNTPAQDRTVVYMETETRSIPRIDNNYGVHYAGAVQIYNGGEFYLKEGQINENYAWDKGGAVYALSEVYGSTKWMTPGSTQRVAEAVFSMSGGRMNNNTAVNRGGAINVESDGVSLWGGELAGNNCRVLGGAVYLAGDGIDRMYQMYINEGSVTGNHAVQDENKNYDAKIDENKRIDRSLNTSTGCDFKNTYRTTVTGDGEQYYTNGSGYDGFTGDHVDFNNHYGNGGGLWLCAYGGNATFGYGDGANVVIAGNTSASGSDDIYLSATRADGGSSINVMGENVNHFRTENGAGAELEPNRIYTGVLRLKNTADAGGSSGGIQIRNNLARDGGGIAADGTVVFGNNGSQYRIATDLTVKKHWDDSIPQEERQELLLKPSVVMEIDGEKKTAALPEQYDVRLTGTADTIVHETDLAYESAPWEATMGLPMTVMIDGQTYALYKFHNPYADYNNGRDLDPSKPEDLKQIYKAIGQGRLEAKPTAWHIQIEEFDKDGNKIDEYITTMTEPEIAGRDDVKTKSTSVAYARDKSGVVTANITTNSIYVKFTQKLTNAKETQEPVTEKYINNKVHQTLEHFDDVFTYSIMSYIPRDATEAVITDTLEDTLEFVNANAAGIFSEISVLKDNDHLGNGRGTVATNQVGGVNVRTREAGRVRQNQRNGCSTVVDGKTFTLTLDKGFLDEVRKEDTNGQGFWVKVSFKAKYDEKNSKYKYATVKEHGSWIGKEESKQGGAPEGYDGYVLEGADTDADGKHEGTKNQGSYRVKRGNQAAVEYKTNIVTVEPTELQYKAQKQWQDENGAALSTWPTDENSQPLAVTFELWRIKANGQEETKLQEKTITSYETVSFDKVPTLSDCHYEVREEVTGRPTQAVGVTVDDSTGIYTFTNRLSDRPEVEKYVNNKVHVNLKNFDEVFEYSVMAYVPTDATEITLTDQINEDLLLVDIDGNIQGTDGYDPAKVVVNDGSKNFHGLVIEGAVNTHVGDGTGPVNGHNSSWFDREENRGRLLTDVIEKNAVTVDGRKITVRITEAMMNEHVQQFGSNNDMRGRNIVLSFKAVINPASYGKVIEQINKTGADSGIVDGLHWNKITDDGLVINGADTEADGSHSGIVNDAFYTVKAAGDHQYEIITNTVTVRPQTEELKVSKRWDINGDTTWPSDTQVTFGLYRKKGDDPAVKVDGAEVVLNKDKTGAAFSDLPKLQGVTYLAREESVTINGVTVPVTYRDADSAAGIVGGIAEYIVRIIKEMQGTEEVFVAVNSKGAIEKYVNDDVHADLESFDRAFTYDILAYVPAGATAVTISDELIPALKLDYKDAETATAAIRGTVCYKDTNDHQVNGTVASEGKKITEGVTVETPVEGNERAVAVRVENADGDLDGKWVQATIHATIDPAAYGEILAAVREGKTSVAGLNWDTIRDNGPVTGGKDSHTGLTNKASYKVSVDNRYSSKIESNTVTVVPQTVRYAGKKNWDGIEGSWPGDVEKVIFELWKVANDGQGTPALVDTIELTAANTQGEFKAQPKLVEYSYIVTERAVPKYMIVDTKTEGMTTTITNRPEQPQIEKYVNKDVCHMIGLDEVFTYDILAYITNDADEAEITDTLIDELQLETKPADIKVYDLGEEADHRPGGSVAKRGIEITDDTVTVSAQKEAGRDKLTVAMSGDAVSKHRGHWIKMSFDAKLADSLVADIRAGKKSLADLESSMVTVERNQPVLSDKEHKGLPNEASYKIKVGNDYLYNERSNTVTVKPEEPEIEKYINQNVHKDIELDEVFTYDIIAYVTKDADQVEIADSLTGDLEYISTQDEVAVFDLGTTVDHLPRGSVAGGQAISDYTAAISAQDLTVVISDATAYRGHWVKVRFAARLSQSNIDAIRAGTKTVGDLENRVVEPGAVLEEDALRPALKDGNDPVKTDEKHDGVPNTAGYKIKVGHEFKYWDKSNTVTVKPEQPEVPTVEKTVNSEHVLEITNRDQVFAYLIKTDMPYTPEEYFAITDDVPEVLEIVDKDDIKITVNGKELSKEERDSMLKINGNNMIVEPSKEQFSAWGTFTMEVWFKCRFRADADLTPYTKTGVINKAYLDVDGAVIGSPDDENVAEVKPSYESKKKTGSSKVAPKAVKTYRSARSVKTGDIIRRYGWLVITLLAALLLILFGIRRRRGESR